MSDINPLSTYYSGLQNTSTALQKDAKKEKVNSNSKLKFNQLLNDSSEKSSLSTLQDLPKEIQSLSVEEAAIFLKDQIDMAGDRVSQNPTGENLMSFKKSVQQFMRFVISNNYEINKKNKKGFSKPMQMFSMYNTKNRPRDPRVTVQMINTNLDNLTRGMIFNQRDNLKLLAQIDEIKGLIVDLMQA